MIRDRIKSLRRVRASTLKPNPKNWRRHGDSQRDALSAVLDKVGYADALLARELPDGSLMLVDGHLRADLDPDAKVPVLILNIDEAEADLILATLDPLAAMAEADGEALGGLLRELEGQGGALEEMLKGLADAEGLDVFAPGPEELVDPEPQIDRAAELQKEWGTETGQLWVIEGKAGEHRVLCGDSTKREDVERVMGGTEVASLVTDPPYGISHDVNYERFTQGGTLCGKAKQRNWETPIAGDDKPFDPSPFLGYGRVVLCGANCYSDRLPCGSWLVWIKKRDVNLGQFMSDAEVAWMNHGHGVYVWYHEWDGFSKASERGQSRQHPTQKPVALMARLIEWAKTEEGAIILDPFLGSGTTMVATEQLGRVCYGLEISPAYVAVILQRMKDMGLSPKLEAPGE